MRFVLLSAADTKADTAETKRMASRNKMKILKTITKKLIRNILKKYLE